MAKKQKIELSDKPLESVTIGQIKENKHGWIAIVVIFVLFIGIIYFLPELMRLYQSYVNGATAPDNTTVVNNTVSEEEQDEENDDTVDEKKYNFTEINEVIFNNDIKFSNISLVENELSFDVVNTSENSINLQDENLYFELYKESGDLVNRIALKGVISSKQNISLNYQVKSGAAYYEIKKLFEEDYTYIDLDVDENKTSVLTCTKNSEKLIYTFVDEKLKVIEHTVSYLKTDENYNEKYTEFNNYVMSYGSLNGISAGLSQNATSLNYRMKIDYNTFTSAIDNEYYFAKDTAPRIVNFKIEALLFDCI